MNSPELTIQHLERIAQRLNEDAKRLWGEGGIASQTIACALGFVKDAIRQEIAEFNHAQPTEDSNAPVK